MSNESDLQKRLATLASENPTFENGQRVLDAQSALDVILQEIDTALLGASLSFVSNDALLTLQIGGRRLVMITDAEPISHASVIGKPLSSENKSDCALASKVIQSFAKHAQETGSLTVETAPLALEAEGLSGSIFAERIAVELQDKPFVAAEQNDFETFLERAKKRYIAAIQVKAGEVVSTDGTGPDVAGLRLILSRQLDAYVEGISGLRGDTTSGGCLSLFEDGFEAGQSVGIARYNADTLLFLFKSGDLISIYREFYK
ncbi:MAG: hypothetical protein AAGD04_04375 [Pseudomonadota bacterium]